MVAIQTLPPAPTLLIRLEVFADGAGTRLVDTWEGSLGLPALIVNIAKWCVQQAVAVNLRVLLQLLEQGRAQLADGRLVPYSGYP